MGLILLLAIPPSNLVYRVMLSLVKASNYLANLWTVLTNIWISSTSPHCSREHLQVLLQTILLPQKPNNYSAWSQASTVALPTLPPIRGQMIPWKVAIRVASRRASRSLRTDL